MTANPIKRLAGQTAVYGLSSIIGRLLNYLLVPIYTRLFIPEVYGVVTELYAYVSFLLILLTYGTETGYFRFAQDKERFATTYSTLLSSLAVSSLAFIGLISIFIHPIASAMQYTAHPEYIIWMAVIVAIDAFISIPFARLRLEGKAMKFASLKLINIAINIAMNLYFLLLCPYIASKNPESLFLIIWSPGIGVGYVFISNLIANITTLLMFIPSFIKVKYRFDVQLLKQLLLYSFPLLIAGFAGMINETLDRILLKYCLPDQVNAMEQIGIYGANYKLAILMTLFVQMFRYAADPFFFAEAKKSDAKATYALVMKYFVIGGLFLFLGVMLYLDFVKYFIDPEYHSGLMVVPVLLMANLFLGMYYNMSIWYKLNDKTIYGAYIAIIGAFITIALNVALIPFFGFIGSAWATFICYLTMFIISYLLGQKHYPVKYPVKAILLYFVVALVIYFISIVIPPTTVFLHYAFNTVLFVAFGIFVVIREGLYKKYILPKLR
ncbi:MAG TPA: oligosaccharide flippase family protein [Bacteroidales bacterium]|nr:oligosaccharide flippase family protein [Bacteroidales bacterium]